MHTARCQPHVDKATALWPLSHVHQCSMRVRTQAGTVLLSAEVGSAAEGHRHAMAAAAVSSMTFDAGGQLVASVLRGGMLTVHTYEGIRQGCARW